MEQVKVVGPVGARFDKHHKMFADRQIFRVTDIIGLSITHSHDERNKGRGGHQFG